MYKDGTQSHIYNKLTKEKEKEEDTPYVEIRTCSNTSERNWR